MRNSVTVWFKEDDVPVIDFEKDNDMVTLYLGKDLEIYMNIEELKYLGERIAKFVKETDNVVSKR